MPSSLSKSIDNSKIANHYNHLGKTYLKSWQSCAKKDINRFEAEFVNGSVKKPGKNGKKIKVLEVGFGPGRIAGLLLKNNIEYYGIDISGEMLSVFKQKIGENNKIKGLKVVDVEKENFFENVKFDLMVAVRVLYYSKNWPGIIEKLAEKLNYGGTILFTMPNMYSLATLGNLFGKVKGRYTNITKLRETLAENDLKAQILGYAKIPDIVYDVCDSKRSAKILKVIEIILRNIFGELFLTKMFYIVAEKRKGVS